MDLKKPLSFEDLVLRLKDHNMEVEDSNATVDFLKRVNYYRLSGYAIQYRISEHNSDLINGVSFDNVTAIYDFDAELRNILRRYIEIVEVLFRTTIAHSFSMIKCANPPHDQHYDKNNYYKKTEVEKIINDFKRQKVYYKDTLILQHHREKYGDRYPLWVITEMLPLSTLSKYYSCLYTSDQEIISNVHRTTPVFLRNHMKCISILRNKCAHASRLYNTKMSPPAKFRSSFLKKHNSVANDSLFAYIILLCRYLPTDDYKRSFISSISNLIDEYSDTIELKLIGFPLDYKSILTNI